MSNNNHYDNETYEQELAILAAGIHSFHAQAHNGKLDSVTVPENIKTAEEFVEWIKNY